MSPPPTSVPPHQSPSPHMRTPLRQRYPASHNVFATPAAREGWKTRFRQQCLDRVKHEREQIVRKRRRLSDDMASSDGWEEGDRGLGKDPHEVRGMDVDGPGDLRGDERGSGTRLDIDRILKEEWDAFRQQYQDETTDDVFSGSYDDYLDEEFRDEVFYAGLVEADMASKITTGNEVEEDVPEDVDMDEEAFIEDMLATHLYPA
ncbi:hypothetical protein M427DRAFT_69731 [Gonapodya prolifera JEL478]|uniref:Uncharacterized protein n=1 Tax=Gonapodya prolifera (strain JEL478) TaxID=1344416 RepID=A0A139AH96_GONPJ|nr:hypothetical protein M427DRAFT_69731 [Gonapodya prolifera JEL478]|eukprot:KXS15815.1 hypothetical protein M427DRAFT_69731 [Gonapodya prolifera JEL478]